MFKVQSKRCKTCIYNKNSPLNLEQLENQVKDRYGFYSGHRICHSSKNVCCRGFWDKHKDEFAAGQIAQRLKLVEFVECEKGEIE